jgi:hypothetical protein
LLSAPAHVIIALLGLGLLEHCNRQQVHHRRFGREMATSMRYNAMKKLHGEEKFARIWNSKILMVGAGGIGCEVRFMKVVYCY